MKKKPLKTILILLIVNSSFVLSYSQTDSSTFFNKKGLKHFSARQYTQAVHYFEKAVKKDYNNWWANYNLARTYSVLTTLRSKCNTSFYAKTIEYLKYCLSIDSVKTLDEVKKEKAFYGLKNEYEFNVLIHKLSFYNPKHIKGFIVGKTFRTSTPGSSYSPINTLTINKNGTWTLSFHENSEEMFNYWHGSQEGNPPTLKIGTKRGVWRLQGHHLKILDKAYKEINTYKLKKPGVIGNMYYPDPNDMRSSGFVRHYWKTGNCGCDEIEGL